MKGLRFYPNCKLTSLSATFMGADKRHKLSESETRDSLPLTAIAVATVPAFAPFHLRPNSYKVT